MSAEFTVRNLHVFNYAIGTTEWVYRAPHSPVYELMTPGFFDGACDMMSHGDILVLSGQDTGAIRYVAIADGHVELRMLA